MAKKKKSDRPLFVRGYKELVEVMKTKGKFIRNCDSCHYFYEAKGDDEELCQNESVLQYDVTVDGNTIFCHYWKPTEDEVEDTEEDTGYLSRFKKLKK